MCCEKYNLSSDDIMIRNAQISWLTNGYGFDCTICKIHS